MYDVFQNSNLCPNCYDQLEFGYQSFKINGWEVETIYQYEDNIRQMLFNLKIKGDFILARAILSPCVLYLRMKYIGYTVVVTPSTKEANQKRGFNHVKALFEGVGFSVIDGFEKTDDWKQSAKSWAERRHIYEHIRLRFQPNPRRRYLLVDDIITSGNTLLACAKLLQKAGVKKIKLFAVANNYRTKFEFLKDKKI